MKGVKDAKAVRIIHWDKANQITDIDEFNEIFRKDGRCNCIFSERLADAINNSDHITIEKVTE